MKERVFMKKPCKIIGLLLLKKVKIEDVNISLKGREKYECLNYWRNRTFRSRDC